MLSLTTPDQLAGLLSVKVGHLIDVLRNTNRHLRAFDICNSGNPNKVRRVVSARPPLYNLQRAFLRAVLLPNLTSSLSNHGGVRGRSIRTNALAHVDQHFVYTTDISDFFPSIRAERVKAWFERIGCSPRVSWMCARLCTADGRLQQGLITSPFIADQLMIPVDRQIIRACERLDPPLVYTRYVDDISISGRFDLETSRFPQLVRRILKLNGFRAKVEKEQFGTLEEGTAVTKVRVRNGRLDVQKEYAVELVRTLHDHISLGAGDRFTGPYYTREQLWGKVSFASWVNPGRRPQLLGKLRMIDWEQALAHAQGRGFITARSVRVGKDTP
jgi:hypothetical protein